MDKQSVSAGAGTQIIDLVATITPLANKQERVSVFCQFLSLRENMFMRRTKTLMSAAITLSAAVLPLTQAVADSGRVKSHIPAQDLKHALKAFAHARGIKLQYTSDQVKGLKTIGVDGDLTAEEELGTLLSGTGLTFQFTSGNAVRLVPTAAARFVAQASRTALGSGAGDAPQLGPKPDLLSAPPMEEVIVTAQKRAEQLLTVPVPVTVLEGSDLTAKNELHLQDYYSQVPGLQYAPLPGQGGQALIAIRGIVAGTGLSPTVEPTIDGVSFGSSTGFGGGGTVPDFDPSDIERVEVLKGPQGTLYGANSLGGLIQYVTVDPSLDEYSGRVSAGASDVTNGTQAGANVRAAVNVPLSDTLAVRASAYARQDPGYIDDPTYNLEGVNEARSYGGHVAVLYQPSDDFSAKFSTFFQHYEQFGTNYVDSPNTVLVSSTTPTVVTRNAVPISTPSDLALQQDSLPFTGGEDRTLQAYVLTLDGKVHPFDHNVDLTSITSYSKNRNFESSDLSINQFAQPLTTGQSLAAAGLINSPAGTGTFSNGAFDTEKYTQELRLTTDLGSHVDWLFGLFYTHENSSEDGGVFSGDVNTPAQLLTTGGDSIMSYKEYAVFTDFTFKITDRFDIQVGGRETETKQKLTEFNIGPLDNLLNSAAAYYGEAGVPGAATASTSDNSFTYLFTPRYKLLEDQSTKVMVYARLSSGFRPGGVNPLIDPTAVRLPSTFGPDKTYNYDLGLKADLFDRTLFIDLSAFYIDWKNIQLSAESLTPVNAANGILLGNSGFVNGARARSDGVEFATEYRPLPGLTLNATATYDDARLTEGLPTLAANSIIANSNDRLPFTARFVGNFGANYEFPIYNSVRGFAGAQYSYVGDRMGSFPSNENGGPPPLAAYPRQVFGAYGEANVQIGAKWSTWTAELYGTNVTDKRGVLGGGAGEGPPYQFIYITPRTIGIELSFLF